tara:strand:+ start:1467 stop:2120 length:654 start_codon:yes stop_codon:yes gene_type:complete
MAKFMTNILRKIFHSYKVGDIVSEMDTNLFKVYMDPYILSSNKRTGDTAYIIVKESQYKQCVFYYYNKDGEYATASIPKAVKYFHGLSIYETPRRRVYAACRFNVNEQIMDYKKSLIREGNNGNVCQLCGQLCEYGESETDHYPTKFSDIFDTFMSDKNFHEIKLIREMDIHWSIKDTDLKKEWKKYHLQHANYRELCKNCHKLHTMDQLKNKQKSI